jgi:hypothetical protein
MSWSPCCTLHFLAWTLLLCLVAAHTRTPAFSAPNSPTFTGSNSWNPVPPGRDISTNQFSSVTGPIASLSFSLALPCREKRGARQRDGSQKQCRERWHPRCFSRFESCREQQNPRESFCFGTLQRCSVDALRVTKERRTVGRRIVFFWSTEDRVEEGFSPLARPPCQFLASSRRNRRRCRRQCSHAAPRTSVPPCKIAQSATVRESVYCVNMCLANRSVHQSHLGCRPCTTCCCSCC